MSRPLSAAELQAWRTLIAETRRQAARPSRRASAFARAARACGKVRTPGVNAHENACYRLWRLGLRFESILTVERIRLVGELTTLADAAARLIGDPVAGAASPAAETTPARERKDIDG